MEHFADKDPEYFLKGIEMLVHRCETGVEVKGDYIEKQQSCFISVTFQSWSGRKLMDPTTYYPKQRHPSLCSATSLSFCPGETHKLLVTPADTTLLSGV